MKSVARSCAVSVAKRVTLGSNVNQVPELRGNTVGVISVVPETYLTNTKATTRTVGASGADFTTVNAAWAASSAGDVIEIIDDSTALSGALSLNRGFDADGLAIKIKGKSTKSTIVLFNTAVPLNLASNNRAVEFENIIFTEPTNTVTNWINSVAANVTGFIHLINCEIQCRGIISITNIKELVLDNVVLNDTQAGSIALGFDSTVNAAARVLINNCTIDNDTENSYLIQFNQTGTATYHTVNITNSTITTDGNCVSGRGILNLKIEGNTIQSLSGASINAGYEASGSAINGVTAWSNATNYVVGNLVDHKCILYRCLINNSNSAPNRDVNANWEIARLITGTFKNNLVYRTNYVTTGHGVFLGFGCYGFEVSNNIIDNYSYLLVVKGFNNSLKYNCLGKNNAAGILIYANDQNEIRNNTFRNNGICLIYGPQAEGMEGLINTIFRDNIFYSEYEGAIITDIYSRWVSPPAIANEFINNKYYAVAGIVTFEGDNYNLFDADEFAAYQTAIGETTGHYVNPEFTGSNRLIEAYYKPNSATYLTFKDSLGQSVGAVDLVK